MKIVCHRSSWSRLEARQKVLHKREREGKTFAFSLLLQRLTAAYNFSISSSSFIISYFKCTMYSFQCKEKLPINFEIDSVCGGGERRLWIPIKKSLACISSSDWTLMERFSTPFLRKTTGDRKVPLGETWCFLNHQVSDWLPFELLKKNWQVLSWEKETSYKRKIL